MGRFNRGQAVIGLAALLLGLSLPGLIGVPLRGAELPISVGPSPQEISAGGPRAGPGQTSSAMLALTPDGQQLLVVNPDSNTLTLLDASNQTVLAEIEVGRNPRAVAVSGDRAFVVNQASDDLTLLDLGTRSVTGRMPLGDRPVGVAVSPDGRFLAVAELGDDQIRFLDADQLTSLSSQKVFDRPFGLAFTPDGARLLVTHLLSGQVTVIDVRPFSLFLPLMGHTLAPRPGNSVAWAAAVEFPISSPASLRTIPTWPQVAPAPAVVVNSAGTRAYLPQTMANGQGFNTQFDTSVFPKISVLDLQAEFHQSSEHISLPETDQPVGLPWAAALTPDEQELWVVNAASNDLSVIDISEPTSPHRRAHLPLGDNPRGIVFSPDGSTAYVNNTLAGTISVIDTGLYTVTSVVPVTQLPLPAVLLQGKRLFHSSARPDLARARWIACNTCHVEGEHDGRTWLLQFMGESSLQSTTVITRNTTSLLGMIETYPLRWSAEWDESADSEFSVRFEQFGSGLIHDGDMNPTLGPPNQGRSADLDALAAYIDSLAIPDSPQALTPAAARGQEVFESASTGCLECHSPPLYTDLQTHDVGTAQAPGEWFGPWIDTPTLRFLYDSAPYLHDGRAATLMEVLTIYNAQDLHGITSQLSPQELADLVAFLLALPAQEPVH